MYNVYSWFFISNIKPIIIDFLLPHYSRIRRDHVLPFLFLSHLWPCFPRIMLEIVSMVPFCINVQFISFYIFIFLQLQTKYNLLIPYQIRKRYRFLYLLILSRKFIISFVHSTHISEPLKECELSHYHRTIFFIVMFDLMGCMFSKIITLVY